MEKDNKNLSFSCPFPINDYPNVLLAHGGGGKLMHQLIGKLFLPAFENDLLKQLHDSTVVKLDGTRLAFTTDSYVVHPLFFPGGDIGSLAVNGTVNDLAMSGAKPLYLSIGFIIEEGLPMEMLGRVVDSIHRSASDAGVQIITGDTKVVDHGKGDGVFINTAGIGIIEHKLAIEPKSVRPGDAIIINGDIGRHGMAIMAVREELEFESVIESDCAPLNGLVAKLIDAGLNIHCMRDLTRGGLASALVEISEAAKTRIEIDEVRIPVRDDVKGVCEILGFDPMYVANEGRFICMLPETDAAKALEIMRADENGSGASIIGRIADDSKGIVVMRSVIGTSRIIDMLSGEQLPRIC
jgi:hydrogenase expression/formation protein HypE